jgi:hypothetical protein
MQTEALQALEDAYVAQKQSITHAFRDQQRLHLIRQNLSKDLSQAQIDWERLRMTTDVTESGAKQGTKKRKLGASGRVSPVESVASSSSKGGPRRRTIQEPFGRPSTAPPPSTTNIMQNVEDMPPII